MENNGLVCSQDSEGLDSEKIGIGFGIGATIVAIVMGIRAWRTDKALREKNLKYQELIRKHQAEINVLKNDKEREAYKNRLWEALMAETEE